VRPFGRSMMASRIYRDRRLFFIAAQHGNSRQPPLAKSRRANHDAPIQASPIIWRGQGGGDVRGRRFVDFVQTPVSKVVEKGSGMRAQQMYADFEYGNEYRLCSFWKGAKGSVKR
jgi:hypothetical protein